MANATESLPSLDELMQSIRDELSGRPVDRRAEAAQPERAPRSAARTDAHHTFGRIEQHLQTARTYAPISQLIPQFIGWSRTRKTLARGAARGVMYFSQFITNKQAKFNEAITAAVQELVSLAHAAQAREEDVHLQLDLQNESFELFSAALEHQREAIDALTRDVELLAEKIDRLTARSAEAR